MARSLRATFREYYPNKDKFARDPNLKNASDVPSAAWMLSVLFDHKFDAATLDAARVNEAIKKNYRQIMSRVHPDKIRELMKSSHEEEGKQEKNASEGGGSGSGSAASEAAAAGGGDATAADASEEKTKLAARLQDWAAAATTVKDLFLGKKQDKGEIKRENNRVTTNSRTRSLDKIIAIALQVEKQVDRARRGEMQDEDYDEEEKDDDSSDDEQEQEHKQQQLQTGMVPAPAAMDVDPSSHDAARSATDSSSGAEADLDGDTEMDEEAERVVRSATANGMVTDTSAEMEVAHPLAATVSSSGNGSSSAASVFNFQSGVGMSLSLLDSSSSSSSLAAMSSGGFGSSAAQHAEPMLAPSDENDLMWMAAVDEMVRVERLPVSAMAPRTAKSFWTVFHVGQALLELPTEVLQAGSLPRSHMTKVEQTVERVRAFLRTARAMVKSVVDDESTPTCERHLMLMAERVRLRVSSVLVAFVAGLVQPAVFEGPAFNQCLTMNATDVQMEHVCSKLGISCMAEFTPAVVLLGLDLPLPIDVFLDMESIAQSAVQCLKVNGACTLTAPVPAQLQAVDYPLPWLARMQAKLSSTVPVALAQEFEKSCNEYLQRHAKQRMVQQFSEWMRNPVKTSLPMMPPLSQSMPMLPPGGGRSSAGSAAVSLSMSKAPPLAFGLPPHHPMMRSPIPAHHLLTATSSYSLHQPPHASYSHSHSHSHAHLQQQLPPYPHTHSHGSTPLSPPPPPSFTTGRTPPGSKSGGKSGPVHARARSAAGAASAKSLSSGVGLLPLPPLPNYAKTPSQPALAHSEQGEPTEHKQAPSRGRGRGRGRPRGSGRGRGRGAGTGATSGRDKKRKRTASDLDKEPHNTDDVNVDGRAKRGKKDKTVAATIQQPNSNGSNGSNSLNGAAAANGLGSALPLALPLALPMALASAAVAAAAPAAQSLKFEPEEAHAPPAGLKTTPAKPPIVAGAAAAAAAAASSASVHAMDTSKEDKDKANPAKASPSRKKAKSKSKRSAAKAKSKSKPKKSTKKGRPRSKKKAEASDSESTESDMDVEERKAPADSDGEEEADGDGDGDGDAEAGVGGGEAGMPAAGGSRVRDNKSMLDKALERFKKLGAQSLKLLAADGSAVTVESISSKRITDYHHTVGMAIDLYPDLSLRDFLHDGSTHLKIQNRQQPQTGKLSSKWTRDFSKTQKVFKKHVNKFNQLFNKDGSLRAVA